ncbi:MAG: PP2C family protein-serine/threonine phosphatase, partial [Bacteroidota bacterium]
VDKSSGMITYAAANNAPVLVRKHELIELSNDRMPVGVGERKQTFELFTIEHQKGDIIYLYTDGYPDQFGGPKGKKFKYKQLNELLLANANLPLAEQRSKLKSEFENWKGDLEQVDDVCVIGIRI